ncbi:DUF6864 domain-containing function [Pedobacter vanadiisoli]|uniref:DUF6864 domain-containing function n=1 Tax=Pedobacter vanadiisoli TaxID=1761975 RepID=A0ABW5MKS4_9SPHI
MNVTATSTDGFKRRIIYNESILLVDIDDTLSFSFHDEKLKITLTLNFTFSKDGEPLKTSGNLSEDKKTVNMILYKWDKLEGSEILKPVILTATQSGKKIWIKFKSSADVKNSFRFFHLTIWGEE